MIDLTKIVEPPSPRLNYNTRDEVMRENIKAMDLWTREVREYLKAIKAAVKEVQS